MTSRTQPGPVSSRSVKFFSSPIRTVVTSTPAVARQWVYDLRRNHNHNISDRSLVVGLGVQWRANFTSGNSYAAATLQLCVDTDCLIFQLHHASAVPTILSSLLSDEGITFVGVHNGSDRRALANSRHKLEVGYLVVLAWAYPKWSLQEMASRLLGADNVEKPKELRLSSWEASCLSNDQVQFECVDALVSYLLAGALDYYPQKPMNGLYVTSDGRLAQVPYCGRRSEYYTYEVVDDPVDDDNDDDIDGSFVSKYTWHSGDDGNQNGVVRPDIFFSYKWHSGDDDIDGTWYMDRKWYSDDEPNNEEDSQISSVLETLHRTFIDNLHLID